MDRDTLRITLDALRTETESMETRVREMQVALEESQQRLQHLRGAVQNIQFIIGDEPSKIPRVEGPLASTLPDIHGADSGAIEDEESLRMTANLPSPSSVKRTPSTEWMAEVINSSDHAMTREDVFLAYERAKGIPESWTNPRTAMANAIGRAVKRGMIKQLSGDRYAPLAFDPFADRSSAQDERQLGLEAR